MSHLLASVFCHRAARGRAEWREELLSQGFARHLWTWLQTDSRLLRDKEPFQAAGRNFDLTPCWQLLTFLIACFYKYIYIYIYIYTFFPYQEVLS